MQSAGSLLRFFDIGFLAPGSLLLAACYISKKEKLVINLPSEFVPAVIIAIVITVLAYLLGLTIHIVGKLIRSIESSFRGDCGMTSDVKWLNRLQQSTKDELATYFWYMRTTCTNFSASIIISWAVLLCNEKTEVVTSLLGLPSGILGSLLVVSIIASLIYSSSEFRLARESITRAKS